MHFWERKVIVELTDVEQPAGGEGLMATFADLIV